MMRFHAYAFVAVTLCTGCGGGAATNAGGPELDSDGGDTLDAAVDAESGQAGEGGPDTAWDGADADADPDSGNGGDGPSTNANQAPVAVIGASAALAGKPYSVSAHDSYDPDIADVVTAYDWTITIDGVSSQHTGVSASVFIPCHAKQVDITLVVTDHYGLASIPATRQRAVEYHAGGLVSVNDCVPSDECGTADRPWCTMTAAYEHRQDIHAGTSISVLPGMYEQGTSQLGGTDVDTPETLTWQSSTPWASEVTVSMSAVTSLSHDLEKATCDGWDSAPDGVVVLVHDRGGWQVEHTSWLTLQGFCVISLPDAGTGSVTAMRVGGSAAANGMVVRTDLVPAPFPIVSAAFTASAWAGDAYVELNNSDIIVGSATYEAGGVRAWDGAEGNIHLYGANVTFASDAAAPRTYGFRSYGVAALIAHGEISGGPGVELSIGVDFWSSMRVSVDGAHVFGDGLGENIGVLVHGTDEPYVSDAEIEGRRGSPVPITVTSATGVKVENPGWTEIRAGKPIVGTGDGVTATNTATGLYIGSESGHAGWVSVAHSGGSAKVLGGTSLHRSVGIDLAGAMELDLFDVAHVAGGQVAGPESSTDSPSVAAGIYLSGDGGRVIIDSVGEIRGCEPACVDNGVALDDLGLLDQPALLGAGLLLGAETASWPPPKGAWTVEVRTNTNLTGGAIHLAASGGDPVSELAGIWAVGDDNGGHSVLLGENVKVRGTVPDASEDVPLLSAGVRLERSTLEADGLVEIAGGPARQAARGVWLRNAFPSGGEPPAKGATLRAHGTTVSPFRISGNPDQDQASRPIRVYGIQDESHEAQDVANHVELVGQYPGNEGNWSTIEGGWAAADAAGDAIGASLQHTAQVSIEHVRIHGGAVPGGRRQRGLEMTDVRPGVGGVMAVVDGCLIEACGHVEGSSHHPECAAFESEPSAGAVVHATPDALRWPLRFSNNLVFGGFNTLPGGGGSVGLLATVDDVPAGTPPARHFLYNFFSGQGAAPLAACGTDPASEATSEAVRLAVWHPSAGSVVQSTVAEFTNNLFHDGGAACHRWAVREEGLDADLRGISMPHNGYVFPMTGRDQLGPEYTVALIHEARAGGAQDRCLAAGVTPFPACIDGAATVAADYSGSIEADPVFGGPGAAILVDVPGVMLPTAFRPSNGALKAGLPVVMVLVDMAGAMRGTQVSTMGPLELP